MSLLVASHELPAAGVRVDVGGVSGQLRANVIASLSIYQERDREDLTPARVRRLHEQASREIRAALQPFGYYRPTIHGRLEQESDGWAARYDIDPADPVPVDAVDLKVTGDGENDLEYRKLIDNFPLRRGSPLDHTSYEDAKRAFQRL